MVAYGQKTGETSQLSSEIKSRTHYYYLIRTYQHISPLGAVHSTPAPLHTGILLRVITSAFYTALWWCPNLFLLTSRVWLRSYASWHTGFSHAIMPFDILALIMLLHILVLTCSTYVVILYNESVTGLHLLAMSLCPLPSSVLNSLPRFY